MGLNKAAGSTNPTVRKEQQSCRQAPAFCCSFHSRQHFGSARCWGSDPAPCARQSWHAPGRPAPNRTASTPPPLPAFCIQCHSASRFLKPQASVLPVSPSHGRMHTVQPQPLLPIRKYSNLSEVYLTRARGLLNTFFLLSIQVSWTGKQVQSQEMLPSEQGAAETAASIQAEPQVAPAVSTSAPKAKQITCR